MSVICSEIKKTHRVHTPQGTVHLLGPAGSHGLKKLTLDEGLRSSRSPDRQKEALINIADSQEGMVYIALHQTTVIGYVSFHYPNKYSRWSNHPHILELGAIEVAPRWRKHGIGYKLLQTAFTNPVLENFIVITTEFYWHWDLEKTRMTVWQYQKMLARLFGSIGMKRVPTDDPSILEHLANVLMVRFGKRISRKDIELFEALQFEKGNLEDAKTQVTAYPKL